MSFSMTGSQMNTWEIPISAWPWMFPKWLESVLGKPSKPMWQNTGNKYELAPDPMNEEITEQLKDIVVGKPETFKEHLKPILSNERIFFVDIYTTGLGEKIENMFREMLEGSGAIKATVHKYVGKV